MTKKINMMKIITFFLTLFIFSTNAEVKLPDIFSNNMVLQRNKEIPIWGTALANEKIKLSFGTQEVVTTADEYGCWSVKLKALRANSKAQVLKVNHLRIQNVLIGEVWLCVGTASMDYPLRKSLKGTNEIKNADNSLLRLASVTKQQSPLPNKNVEVKWKAADSDHIKEFSGLAYFFGKKLNQEIDVPIGIIQASQAGTPMTSWIPAEAYRDSPELKWGIKQIYDGRPSSELGKKSWQKYLKDMKLWLPQARKALAKNQTPIDRPEIPSELWITNIVPTKMFNGMIHPLIPFSIRGVIWDQGNVRKPKELFNHQKALIVSWRKLWDEGELPFYFVEPLVNSEPKDLKTEVQKAIEKCLSIKNTAMAISADLQTANPKAPQNKRDIGLRLAHIALQNDYQNEIKSGQVKAIQVVIGTGSEGVYSASFNKENGNFSKATPLFEKPGTVLVKTSVSGLLYTAGNTKAGGVLKSFLETEKTGEIRDLPKDPCYMALDKSSRFAFTANIHGNSISSFSLKEDGSLDKLVQHLEIKTPQKGFAPHCVIPSPDNKYLFVADIGGGRICRVKFNKNDGSMIYDGEIVSKNFNGPRHLVFGFEGKFLYLLNQMGGAVTVFKYERKDGSLQEIQHISCLAKNFKGNNHSAEIRIHPSGDFLYCTNRGPDSISLFKRDKNNGMLKFIETVSSGGKTPVSFIISPDGKYLLSCNIQSNNISLFKIDLKTGCLTASSEYINVPSPVSLSFRSR
ncbi:lactonase family protein [Lentisphaera profundi]|uniref:Lactonase family protein n=1 Tax=Lentisphaera profundi TaxID=1658616 RepID=A0ABY7W0F1_9BACT|nr:lactonase family protein [Lentisphaera profundi]WDE97753.1 lactonase family protein [Lentisphaera profundi]